MTAIDDIAKERRRQIEKEGWTAAHDDNHTCGSLARAAGMYAMCAGSSKQKRELFSPHIYTPPWPWETKWWKPTTPRRDLVKAGALIIAEIERIDRLENSNI